MRRSKLDKIDKNILKNLQDDGRMTNVELAKTVGISAPPCLRRVRALEEAGLINSYHAFIDPAAFGYTVTVFALVKLTSHAKTDLEAFSAQVETMPMVRECHMLAGEIDFMLKVVAKDWDDYQAFLTDQLTAIDNVVSVNSSLTIGTTKNVPGVPIEA